MKKNYILTFLLTLCISTLSLGQDLLITGVIDGPLPGGFPKGFELYAVNAIPDLSIYGLESTTNGAAATGAEYTFPTDAIAAGTFIYIGHNNSSSGFTQYLGVTPQYEDNVASVNGNDTVILYKNDVIEDLLGRVGEDGSNTDWDHLDGWAYRKSGNGPSATFDASEWTFSGANALDGCDKSDDTGTNSECSSVFPVGAYSAVASTTPLITVAGSTSSFDYFEGYGPSAEQSVTISGENLTDDISIVVPTNFEVSLTSGTGFATSATITQTGGVASATVYLRLAAGLSSNTYTGDATASSAGADDNTGSLTGVVSPADPQFYYTAYLDDFSYIAGAGTASAEQTFTVEGLFLLGDLKVTAPDNYEVSLTTGTGFDSSVSLSPSSGTIAETIIYIRLKAGLAEANYAGDITLTSITVDDKTIAVNGNVFGSVTKSMIITGIYDGPLTGGTPKGVELFVLEDIADLSVYGVSSVSNGGGSTAGNVEFSFNQESATAGSFIYVTNDADNFKAFFGIDATYTSGIMSINGDDAIELYENGQIIDVYGDVNADFSDTDYDYLDGWAYRKSNITPEGTTFTSDNWTYSGINVFDGETLNSSAPSPFPIGSYTNSNTASVGDNFIEGFATYPNPVTNNKFILTSNNNAKKDITIFNVLGKKVLSLTVSGTKTNVDVSDVSSGVYILKVTENGKTATKKLVVR